MYFNKNKKFEPVSQLEPISVCVPISNSRFIEEHNNNPILNPYYVPKSQEEKKKQVAFKNILNYLRRKKKNVNTPKTCRKKLIETEKKERRKIYMPLGEKK